MDNKYYVYTHKTTNGDLFYVGVSKFYNRGNPYYRAFDLKTRNKYWLEIFNKNGCKCEVEIIEKSITKETAYSIEIDLIKKYGKIHNKTGVLANMQDGGFVSDWGKAVCSYDYDGNFIKKYSSINEAAKDLGIKSKDSIYFSINNGSGVYGVRFLYYSENYLDKLDPYIPSNECYQYSRTGKFIKKWRTVEDAAKALKIDRGGIRNNIYKKSLHCGGFVWSYVPINFSSKQFEIGQFNIDGKLIKKYPNAMKAQKETNVFNSSILLCCKGKINYAGGFIWKFIEIN